MKARAVAGAKPGVVRGVRDRPYKAAMKAPAVAGAKWDVWEQGDDVTKTPQ